jgi:hypothetical protein
VLFAGVASPECEIAADCNGDRAVDVSDAIFDLRYLFDAGSAPPAPYPLCDEAELSVCVTDSVSCLP